MSASVKRAGTLRSIKPLGADPNAHPIPPQADGEDRLAAAR